MHDEGPDLVRVSLPCLPIDPSDESVESGLVFRIGEVIYQQRDPAARFPQVAVHGVADVAVVPAQGGKQVADMRDADVFPVQIRRVGPPDRISARARPRAR